MFIFSKPNTKLLLIAGLFHLQSCDLGDFSPVDIFSREALEEDALSVDVGTSCDFSILTNNDRYLETTEGLEIKGSVYLETSATQYYLSSGEFELTTDSEGKISSLEGYGTAAFPETSLFEDATPVGDYLANISLLENPDLSSIISLSVDEQCYIYYNIDQDTAKITTSNGDFTYTELYFEPTEPLFVFKGTIDLPSIKSNFGWTGISHEGNIEFLPENFTQELTFESFNGHVFMDAELPFTVNNLPVTSYGENTINANKDGSGAKSFFDGTTESIELGTNGSLAISYLLADTIIAEYSFYSDTVSRTNESLYLTSATSHWENVSGVEEFSFVGEYEDSVDLYDEILLSHPVLDQLIYNSDDNAIVFGTYGTNYNLWDINILNDADMDLGDLGIYSFRDAILSVSTEGIEFSGIFQSPLSNLPNMLIAGDIQDNGNFTLNGQSLFAVNFNGTTLPVTYSLEVEVIDGVAAINVTGLAEYCVDGNCQFLPVTTTLDVENQTLEVCVEIPDEGEICID